MLPHHHCTGAAARPIHRRTRAPGLGLALCVAALPVACDRHPTEPRPGSYLAVYADVQAPADAPLGAWSFAVTEISGTTGIDTVLSAGPGDTTFLPVPLATYAVRLQGLPTWCSARYGTAQQVVVSNEFGADGTVTAIARFGVACVTPLVVRVFTDGGMADPEYVYRLERAGRTVRTGVAASSDTLLIEGLPPGEYDVFLEHVAPRCVATSDGGTHRRATVAAGVSAEVDFRVVCSDSAHAPRIVEFHSAYRNGVSTFHLRATDPDRDVEAYWWDLTDCRGNSLLPVPVQRRNLTAGRTAGADTATVIGAFEPGLADAEVAGKCTAIRVVDALGNSTARVEEPIGGERGSSPRATHFNAVLAGTTLLRAQLSATDADGDFAGVFALLRLRDGALGGRFDGAPDVGIYNVSGYLTTTLPDVVLGTRFRYDDVLSAVVYLVDRQGNGTRVEDADTFR